MNEQKMNVLRRDTSSGPRRLKSELLNNTVMGKLLFTSLSSPPLPSLPLPSAPLSTLLLSSLDTVPRNPKAVEIVTYLKNIKESTL